MKRKIRKITWELVEVDESTDMGIPHVTPEGDILWYGDAIPFSVPAERVKRFIEESLNPIREVVSLFDNLSKWDKFYVVTEYDGEMVYITFTRRDRDNHDAQYWDMYIRLHNYPFRAKGGAADKLTPLILRQKVNKILNKARKYRKQLGDKS